MASSEWGIEWHGAWRAILTSTLAWCSAVKDVKQWIQVNLGTITRIYGVVIQGRYRYYMQWVTEFKVMYKNIGGKWTFVKKYESDEDMVRFNRFNTDFRNTVFKFSRSRDNTKNVVHNVLFKYTHHY